MRSLLVGLALAHCAGIVAADRVDAGEASIAACLVGSLAVAAWLRGAAGRACMAMGLAFCAGVGSLAGQLAAADRSRIERTLDRTIEARVCDSRATSRSSGVVLCRVRDVSQASRCEEPGGIRVPLEPTPGKLWLSAASGSLEAAALEVLPPGAWLRARVRVRRLEGLRNPGGSSWARTMRRRGIGGAASLIDPDLLVRVAPTRRESVRPDDSVDAEPSIWRTRRRIASRLRAHGPGGALLAALAVGDRSGLDERSSAAIRALGLGHLLAVSGLHLAMVTGLAFAGLRALGVRIDPLARRLDVRALALVGGVGVATGYALLTGFDVPVRRALIFVWVLALQWLCSRGRSPGHALALAALLILADRPASLFDLGAQLSFAAAATLLMARPIDRAGESGLRAVLSGSLSTSALAIGATAPLLALHGLASSPWAMLWNLMAVPLTAFVLLPAALASALGVMLDLGPLTESGVAIASAVSGLGLEGVCWLASKLPMAAQPSPVSWWAAGIAAFLTFVAARIPEPIVRALLAGVAATWLQGAPAPPIGPRPPRIVALDVGQGDSILVQGARASILIDGGRAVAGRYDLGRSVVLPALRSLGVSRLDAVVVSHADLDHRGGLVAVLDGLPVDALWLPARAERDPGLAELVEITARRGISLRTWAAGDRVGSLGDLHVEVLWPLTDDPGGGSRNDRSLVLRVRVGEDRLLLTGDIGADVERALLASGVELGSQILKLPHHGSRSSSTPEFLAAVGPEVVLLSAPCGGGSGLPHPDVLARIQSDGARLVWTGRDGAAWVRASMPGVPRELETWAARRSCLPPARPTPPAAGLCPPVRGE